MLHYTTRFVDGLHDNIHSMIALQRPPNLNIAYTLSLLQEEVDDPQRRQDSFKPNNHFLSKHISKDALPLPCPPGVDKLSSDIISSTTPSTKDDKWTTLRAYRCAKGLCDRYAEKWTRDHKCVATVPLYALQEIWDFFQLEDSQVDEESVSDQVFLAISHDIVFGSQGSKTIQISSILLGIPVMILIDSGSSAPFLNSIVAGSIHALPWLTTVVSVKVANGGIMKCRSLIP